VLAYLRLIANDDDDPAFIRAATTPKRGIGQATLQALGEFASERQLSLFAAVFEIGMTQRLAVRQLEPLQTFAAFIQGIQQRAGSKKNGEQTASAGAEPAGALLDELIGATQ